MCSCFALLIWHSIVCVWWAVVFGCCFLSLFVFAFSCCFRVCLLYVNTTFGGGWLFIAMFCISSARHTLLPSSDYCSLVRWDCG